MEDPFESGEFPFGPRSHDVRWLWMHDMAVVGGMLGCRPGDRVLDLDAGSGLSTKVLIRFGYHVVSLDPVTRHLEAAQTQRARRKLGENDLPLDVRQVAALGKAHGFPRTECRPLPYQLHVPLPVEDLDTFAQGAHDLPDEVAAGQVIDVTVGAHSRGAASGTLRPEVRHDRGVALLVLRRRR